MLEGTIGGRPVEGKPGTVLYIPADTIHSGGAGPDAALVFFTVKDASYGLHGIKAGSNA